MPNLVIVICDIAAVIRMLRMGYGISLIHSPAEQQQQSWTLLYKQSQTSQTHTVLIVGPDISKKHNMLEHSQLLHCSKSDACTG